MGRFFKNRNIFNFLFICLCVILNWACNHIDRSEVKPQLKKGYLDLSQWDFNNQGTFSIHGEWEFYWQRLLTPADFPAGNTIYIKDSKSWKSAQTEDRKIKNTGYATYRMIMKIHPRNKAQISGIILPELWSASTIFINNKKYAHGTPGVNRETTIPRRGRKIIFFVADAEQISIIIQLANFHDINGGISAPLLIGNEEQINSINIRDYIIDIFVFGSMLTICFLFLCFFLLNRKDRGALFFSIFCFLVASRIFIMGGYVRSLILYMLPGIDWELYSKFMNLTMTVSFPFFLMFLYEQFPGKFHKIVVNLALAIGVVCSLLFLFFPLRSNVFTLTLFQILLFFFSTYILVILIQCIIHKKENGVLFFTGAGCFYALMVNDILHQKNIINTGYFAPFGLFVFILFYAFILARKNAQLYFRSEKMTRELQEYSTKLEDKVKQRTLQLEKVNQEKTDLFINLAHETKTPLNIIQIELEDYVKEAGKNAKLLKIYENFNKIKEDMINYLDAQKLEKGIEDYNNTVEIDFAEILESRIDFYKEIFLKNKIQLHTDLLKPVFIKADPQAVMSIINNLFDNALKYTNSSGLVKVKLATNTEYMLFSISNTGRLIPDEEKEHIFKPYYRMPANTKNLQGSGLGLYIVKSVTAMLDGTIELKTSEELGNTFIIRFKSVEKDQLQKRVERQYDNDRDENTAARPLADTPFCKDKDTVFIVEDNRDP